MLLYIIRHADPDYEHDTITELGHRQAKALSEVMVERGVDRIFSSPQGRAIATMKYTAEALGMGYTIEDWTREVWPEMFIEKKTKWGKGVGAFDYPGEFYESDDFISDFTKWYEDPLFAQTQAKERFDYIQECSDEFFARFGYIREKGSNLYKCLPEGNKEDSRREFPKNGKVALFCHAGFGMTFLSQLLNIPAPLIWSGMYIATSSITTLLFEQRSEDWAVPRMVGFNDLQHLRRRGIPDTKKGLRDYSGQEF